MTGARLRWLAIAVFVLSSSLNYLDRLLLAALAPTIKREFLLDNREYGYVLSAFALVYAVLAPVAGWLIDRVGLNTGITVSMALWSLAGMATGWTRSLAGLLSSRTVLGIAESAGIPCTGKANALYLPPSELALGTALNQVGITIGSVAAPLMVAWLAVAYGWRSTFVVSGALGFLWIPLWWITAKFAGGDRKLEEIHPKSLPIRAILKDRRLWGLAIANALIMSVYTLWTNWTTVFFVEQHHLSEIAANRQFAWIPPIFATFGGFFGGWLAFFWIRRGAGVFTARMRLCWIGGVLLLTTAIVPLMHSAALAAAVISLSFFWCLSISTNLYAMPIDFFGAGRAAFSVSVLTCSYGLAQTVLSPLIGRVVDQFGFAGVCVGVAALPLAGVAVLQFTGR